MQTIPLKRAENLKKQSSTRRHAVRYGDATIYISDPLKFGNHKLSKEIAVFDLLAVHSCPNCKECARDCYALKAQRARYEVWDSRAVHTFSAARPRDVARPHRVSDGGAQFQGENRSNPLGR